MSTQPGSLPIPPAAPTTLKTAIYAALRQAFDRSDQFHRDLRALRNRIVVISLITIMIDAGIVVLQVFLPKAPILYTQMPHLSLARWQVVLLVMVFGCVGALLSAIPAMAAIPRVSSPFNVPLQQGLLKLIAGSLTAFVGVLLAGSTTGITTGFTSLPAMLAASAAFGAGQQVVTQFLDRRAGQIASGAPHST